MTGPLAAKTVHRWRADEAKSRLEERMWNASPKRTSCAASTPDRPHRPNP
ncbi:hypothetical protein [Agromyces badenianii]|nr:hypothetical protein [Agromyces badenianii]